MLTYGVVELPASFAVWIVSPEAEFLKGKFVWSNWDVEELKKERMLLEKEKETLRRDVEALRADKEELRRDKSELRHDKEELRREIGSLRSELPRIQICMLPRGYLIQALGNYHDEHQNSTIELT